LLILLAQDFAVKLAAGVAAVLAVEAKLPIQMRAFGDEKREHARILLLQ